MRQGKVLITPMILVAVLCLIGLIVGLIYGIGHSGDAPKSEDSVFGCRSVSELQKFGFEHSLDGSYELNESIQFGHAGFMTASVKDDAVSSITFTADILTGESIKITEAEDAVASFVESYSKDLDFPHTATPQMVRFADEETYKSCPENDYEALIKGYLMFEYSYRDTEGILWIVQIYSPRDNIVSASVMCYPDDSGFTDFEAQINLNKEVME